MSLLYQHNLGGSTWLQQFLVGFKLTCTFSQKDTFPTCSKQIGKRPIDLAQTARSNASRYRGRARKSGHENAHFLWGEAVEQQGKGWLSPPLPLTSSSHAPFTLLDPRLNIPFCFGAQQADKLRACDGLRYSRVNLSCIVTTPH